MMFNGDLIVFGACALSMSSSIFAATDGMSLPSSCKEVSRTLTETIPGLVRRTKSKKL